MDVLTHPPSDQPNSVLIWSPDLVEGLDQEDLDLYVQFASTPCIPGGGCDIEEALEVLYQAGGSVPLAMQQLLKYNKPEIGVDDGDEKSSSKQKPSIWTMSEVENFERLKILHGKDFYLISQLLQTKTRQEVVQFYYKWKKSALRNRLNQGSSPQMSTHSLATSVSSMTSSSYTTVSDLSTTSASTITTSPHLLDTTTPNNLSLLASVLAVTPSASSSSSSTCDESRDSGRGDELMMSMDEHNLQYQQQLQHNQQSLLLLPPMAPQGEIFPCKVCGRIFEKVKSRSAHMKRHKNERLYNSK